MGWETNFDRQSFGSSYVDILNKIKYNKNRKKIENTHAYSEKYSHSLKSAKISVLDCRQNAGD